jgi:hypothetical protein
VFYGINTKIPANYNAKLWREAGVDPYYIDGDHKVILIYWFLDISSRRLM